MTTVITRVMSDVAEAERAVKRLSFWGFSRRTMHIITDNDSAEKQMARAKVHESAIAPYKKKLAAGNAVFVVHAGYKPLNAARLTREALGKLETVDMGDTTQEHKLPWEPERAASVLKDHPLFFTIEGLPMPGRISEMFGMPMLKPHRAKRSVNDKGPTMSAKFWPRPLLKDKGKASSAISGGPFMSAKFWPMKLLSTGERRSSVIPGGGHPLSRRLGLRLIS